MLTVREILRKDKMLIDDTLLKHWTVENKTTVEKIKESEKHEQWRKISFFAGVVITALALTTCYAFPQYGNLGIWVLPVFMAICVGLLLIIAGLPALFPSTSTTFPIHRKFLKNFEEARKRAELFTHDSKLEMIHGAVLHHKLQILAKPVRMNERRKDNKNVDDKTRQDAKDQYEITKSIFDELHHLGSQFFKLPDKSYYTQQINLKPNGQS